MLWALAAALGPGCRCNSSTPAEPASETSAKPPPAPIKCPPQPDWAQSPQDGERLLVELLMQPEQASSRKGTGIRIYDDGRVFAFDEMFAEMKNGKLTSKAIPGRWRQHRTLPAARVDELKALLASESRDELTSWQGNNRTGKGRACHLNVRVGADELRSCYRGTEGGVGQRKVEALTKKLMGEALSSEVNQQAVSEASAAPSAAPPAASPR